MQFKAQSRSDRSLLRGRTGITRYTTEGLWRWLRDYVAVWYGCVFLLGLFVWLSGGTRCSIEEMITTTLVRTTSLMLFHLILLLVLV